MENCELEQRRSDAAGQDKGYSGKRIKWLILPLHESEKTGISSDYLVDASPTAGACFLR